MADEQSGKLGRSNIQDSGDQPEQPVAHEQTKVQPIHDFTHKVQEWERVYQGQDGRGEKKYFVPYRELQSYWRKNKVEEVRKAYHPFITASIDAITKRYLRLFSLLVYLNRVQNLPSFTAHNINDEQFPLPPRHVPVKLDAPAYEELIERIREHQWRFFPLVLDYARLSDLHLEPDHILPFYGLEEIASSDAATVFRVRVHEACDELDKSVFDKQYVLKRYESDQYQNLYRNESKALSTLRSHKNHNIIGYYGCFAQNGTYNLLLQLADRGNLDQYYKETEPPSSLDQIRQFWRSLFTILQGLHCVHHSLRGPESSAEYRGIHQDIKPDNILLGSGKEPTSPYDFVPMMADFGHSHVRVVAADGSDALGIDRAGNAMYSAPECSRHAEYLRTTQNRIPSEADIWSMGCVFSEAAVWVAKGAVGQDEYFTSRVQATRLVPNFEDGTYNGCFHAAIDRLGVIDEVHYEVRQSCPLGDTLTPQVLRLVEDYMLSGNPQDRASAKDIYERFRKCLHEFETQSGLSLSKSSNLSTSLRAVETLKSLTQKAKISSLRFIRGRTVSDESTASGAANSGNTSDTLLSPMSQGEESSPSSSSPRLPPRPDPGSRPPDIRRNSSPGPEKRPAADFRRHKSLSSGDVRPGKRDPYAPLLPSIPAEDEPHVTLQQAGDWRRNWKAYSQIKPDVHRSISNLQGNIKGREHVFVIDNSVSMGQQPHDAIQNAFQTLAYIAKPKVSTGLALAFSSPGPDRIITNNDVSPLLDALKQCQYNQLEGFMEAKFGDLVDELIIPRLPDPAATPLLGPQPSLSSRKSSGGPPAPPKMTPLSVIVFTDGRWGRDTAGAMGVENPVRRLVEEMARRRVPRTHVMIQFVQFGDDEDGSRRLKYLVRFAKEERCGIIATTPITGNVCSMLIGSIDANHDGGEKAVPVGSESKATGNKKEDLELSGTDPFEIPFTLNVDGDGNHGNDVGIEAAEEAISTAGIET